MSIGLTRILQQITGLNTFFAGANAGRMQGVVLEDSASVLWSTDGFGNIQATATAAGQAVQLIQRQTVVGTPTTLTFSAIPQGFSNLRLVGNFSSSGDNLVLGFNGDVTNGHYGWGLVFQNAGAAAAAANETAASIFIAASAGAVDVAIPGYAAAPFGLPVTGTFSQVTIGSATLSGSSGGLWTGADVTSLTLSLNNGAALAAGSVFSLYGEL
jgi:hypothetical protein